MSQKPSLPKGTRDFTPQVVFQRNYIIQTIQKVFQKYGFEPIETPALENLSVLTGKYGDEGDQLLFKVLNSGDYLNKTTPNDYAAGSAHLTGKISEKGLRYDLTVPFARFVAMNQNEISFPFKRYQIQPVWRADRPQRGRYREFYQCDADVVGTHSLLCEAELLAMAQEVYSGLNFFDYQISLSNRKILEGIASACGASDQFGPFCVILDKLDKIGKEKVFEELAKIGLTSNQTSTLSEILNIQGDNDHKLNQLKRYIEESDQGKTGIQEAENTLNYLKALGLPTENIIIDFTLARGLSYYTGMIYEVKPTTIQMGTITAGGRYDNLTGVFGLPDVSGVGISFGIDRIYDTLNELNLFPKQLKASNHVLITHFDASTEIRALQLLSRLRKEGITAELYPEATKLKKQLTYANRKDIPCVLLVGAEEIKSEVYALKHMQTGEQQQLTLDQLVTLLQSMG